MDRYLEISKLVFGCFWYLLAIYFYENFIYNHRKHFIKTSRSLSKAKHELQHIETKNDFFMMKLRMNELIQDWKELRWNRIRLYLVKLANIFFITTIFKIFPIQNLFSFNFSYPSQIGKNIIIQNFIDFINEESSLVLGIIFSFTLNRLKEPIKRKKFYSVVGILLIYSCLIPIIVDFLKTAPDVAAMKPTYSPPKKIFNNGACEIVDYFVPDKTNVSVLIKNPAQNFVSNKTKISTSNAFTEGIKTGFSREIIIKYSTIIMIALIILFVIQFFYPDAFGRITGIIVLMSFIECIRYAVNFLYKGAGDTLLGLFIGISIEVILNN